MVKPTRGGLRAAACAARTVHRSRTGHAHWSCGRRCSGARGNRLPVWL